MADQPYTVTFTRTARRHLNELPLSVAETMYEHLTGAVANNPYRLGKPLEEPYNGARSTRRGVYRAIYEIDEDARSITVLVVAHRRDAYRPR